MRTPSPRSIYVISVLALPWHFARTFPKVERIFANTHARAWIYGRHSLRHASRWLGARGCGRNDPRRYRRKHQPRAVEGLARRARRWRAARPRAAVRGRRDALAGDGEVRGGRAGACPPRLPPFARRRRSTPFSRYPAPPRPLAG